MHRNMFNYSTDIITFLLAWLLVYACGESAANVTTTTRPSPHSSAPDPRNEISPNPCTMVTQFAQDQSAFTVCAIISGTALCKRCVNQIIALTNSYTKLTSDEGVIARNNSKCMETIVSDPAKDRFRQYYSHSREIWFVNNCDNCFVESSQQMRQDVQSFFDGAYAFNTCVDNNPNNTCDQCKEEYSMVNRGYAALEDDYHGNICLDVSAVMLQFRDNWFRLGCISPVAYDALVVVIGLLVIFACLVMYVVSGKLSQIDQPGVLIQKRLMRITNREPRAAFGSSYGAIGS